MAKREKEGEVTATSVFLLESITLKKDTLWRMKLTLKTLLPQTWREYKVRLSVNEEPSEEQIKLLEERKLRVESENQLFDKKQQIRNIDAQISDIEKELAALKKELPVIEFAAMIEALAYKGRDTEITMMFPYTHVEQLNLQRNRFDSYKIELIREE